MLKKMGYRFVSVFAIGIVMFSTAFYLSVADSQPTVSTPVPKSSTQAAEDLKRQVPLDPTKMGELLPANLFVELSKLINPAVVSISTSQNARGRRGGVDPFQQFLEDFWGRPYGGGGRPQQQQPAQALGTGFIIRADGLIITNNHVIEGADVIKVQLDADSNKFYEAKLIGRDSRTDIALIKIDAKKTLPVAPLGSSKDVQVGEWVAAFGNPYGHAHTMTKGIISAIGREIGELNRFPFLQTDASINPGNSGGPLVNTKGYVIGVNTAIDARAQGIGFAIPIDNVKQIIQDLEKSGRVKRGYIGVEIAQLTPDMALQLGLDSPEGVVIARMEPGGPAEKAGLQVYDILTDFNGKHVANAFDLQNAVANTSIGSSAKAKVIRIVNDKKTEKTIEVKVAENPEESKPQPATKKYFGQKAPHELGFKVSDMTPQLKQDLDLIPGAPANPVVIEVEGGSPASRAGLQPGDVILDVNKQPVRKATDVLKLLTSGRNLIRVLRGNIVAIIPLQGK